MTAETALVSFSAVCFRSIKHKHFDFLKFGKLKGTAVRVEEIKDLSDKFCTWKDEGSNETCLVSMNTSMVRYQLYHYKNRNLTTTTDKVVITFLTNF